MNGRHRLARRRRAAGAAAGAASLVGSLVVVFPGAATAAPSGGGSTLDPSCLRPKVADVMVSQGLPSYRRLVAGKAALVKVFLQEPGCAPSDATMRVVDGSLTVTGGGSALVPLAAAPLAEIAPPSTAPIPSAQGDPLFLVPGDRLIGRADTTTPVQLSATITFETTRPNQTAVRESFTVTTRPDGTALTATIEKTSRPLRVLTVPMGNAGNFLLPNSAASQFDTTDRANLTKGMTALGRSLPVADGVTALNATTGGLRTSMSSGLLNVASYYSNGAFCGTNANFSPIATELEKARTNWNSQNPTAPADRVYGVISSRISAGGITGNPDCADGYAAINGTASWGRVINTSAASFTGAIAAMELLHTTGSVAKADPRWDGAFHSRNLEADGTVPDRAWNVPDKTWVAQDASSLNYRLSGWNDGTSLLEQQDYDTLHCQLTPLAPGAVTECPNFGDVGRAGALLSAGSSFFLSGSTDGTPQGTDAHTYVDDDVNYENPVPNSEYQFVQRDAGGAVVSQQGFRVTIAHSHHDGGNKTDDHEVGTFGTQFEAKAAATRLELWKGQPAAPGSVLLHARDRDDAPQFLAASVAGRTVSVTVEDALPQNLRLDVFHVCRSGSSELVSPLVNAARPALTAARSAVFTVPADASLGCADGRLRYRVSDGYLVAQQDESTTTAGQATSTAAIYAPVFDTTITTKKVIGLAGDGRDALGQPADNYEWFLQGPSFLVPQLIATGASTFYVPPAIGLLPGNYTLRLDAKRGSSVLATAVKSLLVKADTDGDGLDDVTERLPCFPLDAVTNQSSAVLDYDFDGFDNSSDPQPCTSASTATAQFTATSFNTDAQGNTVAVKFINSSTDLTKLPLADLAITQIAGHRLSTPIKALSLTPESSTAGRATFDRQAVAAFIQRMGISGPTPIFVTAPSVGFRAGDAQAPTTF